AHWSDGSVKWLLLDFLLRSMKPGLTTWMLCEGSAETKDGSGGDRLRIVESDQTISVDTGVAEFQISRTVLQPFTRVLSQGEDILAPSLSRVVLTDAKGRNRTPKVERVSLEARGPVRATVLLEGAFAGRIPCRFTARLSFFRGTGIVRLG